MHFHVLMVRDRGDQTEDVLAAVGIKAIEKGGVGGAVVAGQLELGVLTTISPLLVTRSSDPTCRTIFISSLAAMASSEFA